MLHGEFDLWLFWDVNFLSKLIFQSISSIRSSSLKSQNWWLLLRFQARFISRKYFFISRKKCTWPSTCVKISAHMQALHFKFCISLAINSFVMLNYEHIYSSITVLCAHCMCISYKPQTCTSLYISSTN